MIRDYYDYPCRPRGWRGVACFILEPAVGMLAFIKTYITKV